MKKTLILAILLFVAVAGRANAVPMHYTFEGTVTQAYYSDSYGYHNISGINVGDAVSYTLLVDWDMPGSRTTYNGTVYYSSGSSYAEYVSGSLFPDSGLLNISNCPDCHASENVAITGSYYSGYDSVYFVGSENSHLQIYQPSSSLTYNGYNTIIFGIVYDEVLGIAGPSIEGSITSTLTLTSVTYVTPGPWGPPASQVPEPSSLLLLGSGLAGLGFWGIRKRRL